jgi:hypothetical protein
MNTTEILLSLAIIVVLVVVVAYVNKPKRYRVIFEKVVNGVNVEKCSNCNAILSQEVYIQSAIGASSHSSTHSTMQINGEEVCPKCGVKLQR